MKKLIAIAVLFVGMTAAVFAQDGGWGSPWKFGFSAAFTTDMLWATSAKESATLSGSIAGTPLADAYEFGNINKGSISFFPYQHNAPSTDHRLQLSIVNSGDNYDVHADITWDDWSYNWGSVYRFLTSGNADWHAKGTLGVFDGFIGNTGYNGWVDRGSTWNGWIGWNQLCRFGLWRSENGGTFLTSNAFQYYNEWGPAFVVGVQPVDMLKFAIGYRLNPYWSNWNGDADKPYDSKSNINAGFILSGRPLDGITFDLFYAVLGGDDNTLYPNKGDGKWANTLGAFVGVNLIDNLGISIGYTGNFNAYETMRMESAADLAAGQGDKTLKVETVAPFYSAVDLRFNFSGIDKLGLVFNANLSFASANGKELNVYYNKVNRRLSEANLATTVVNNPGDTPTWAWKDGWFHLQGELQASLGFIDGVPIVLNIQDMLGVTTTEDIFDDKDHPNKITVKSKASTNEFRVSLKTEYGVGSATLGIGLFLSVASTDVEVSGTEANTNDSFKLVANSTITKFGIPLLFKVAF
jgi:hypothetical protein